MSDLQLKEVKKSVDTIEQALAAMTETLDAEASAANRSVPIFAAHGTLDPLVGVELGRRSRDRLVEAGYAVEWREYPMEHQICGEELSDIGRWLTGVLSPAAGV